MYLTNRFGHVVGGTLLVAATAIGIGMMALPVATGPAGFVPAMSMYVLIWAFMLCSGLLLLEVCTWMPKEANFITMAHKLLGPVGKAACWVLYLFLFVMAMVSHVSGGGSTLSEITNGAISKCGAMALYVALIFPIIYFGTRAADRFNIILMTGLFITFFLFIYFSISHVSGDLLKYMDWSQSFLGIPVLFTAFTYQLIIPTLMTYMDRDVKKVRLAIIIGSSIPLVVYLIWEFLILGIVPVDALHAANAAGDHAVMPLKEFLKNPMIFKVGNWFSFFVLTASYIPLSLAYIDFVADGLKVKKNGMNKILLCLGVFVPPTLIALIYPGIFLKALGYVGGFSCAILFGLMPPLMVWIGRYVKKYDYFRSRLPGGKVLLSILMVFVAIEVVLEVLQHFK
jgi:tyrosine-specific transport protein